MNNEEPDPRSEKPGAKETPATEVDSLDFSHIGPARAPAATAPAVDHVKTVERAPRRRKARTVKKTGSGDVEPTRARSFVVPVLIVVAIGAVTAFIMTDHFGDSPAPAPKSAPPGGRPPPFTPPQVNAPPPKASPQVSTPSPETTAPQAAGPPAVPPEFLKLFQTYTGKPGGKAIALALEAGGRWAYGSVANFSPASEAGAEALSDCEKLRTQAGLKEKCRLYAVGDKVVW